jgi:hypothetical protein
MTRHRITERGHTRQARAILAVGLFLLALPVCGRSPMESPRPNVDDAGPVVGTSGTGDCPPCLAEAIYACIPAGACLAEVHGSGMGQASSSCFGNGVVKSSFTSVSGNAVAVRVDVSKNGRACYTSHTIYEASSSGTITFDDGDGRPLGQGTISATGSTTIDCGGTKYVMGLGCGGWDDRTPCNAGACP